MAERDPPPPAAEHAEDPGPEDGAVPGASAVPVLHLDGFDGPMDLLLELAQRQRIDFGRLSIVALAEQFAAELQGRLRGAPIERRADWLVLAARLLQLRAGLLLAANPRAEADARRDAARMLAGLDEARLVRAAAHWLDERPRLGWDVFARSHGRSAKPASYMALMEACLTALRDRAVETIDEAGAVRIEVADFWRLADALAHVRARLHLDPQGGELIAFVPAPPEAPERPLKRRAAVASTLLACLELARIGELHLEQASGLGPIDVSGAQGLQT